MSIGHRVFTVTKIQRDYINEGIVMTYCNIIHDINDLQNGMPWSETAIATYEYLPKQYAHHYDLAFLNQFLNIVLAIGYKFNVQKVWWRLNSVIEEMAMRAILMEAEVLAEEDGVSELLNIEELINSMYLDLDFEMLFNPQLDGFEEEEEFTKEFGIVNLSFKDWFKPFNEEFYTLNEVMDEE